MGRGKVSQKVRKKKEGKRKKRKKESELHLSESTKRLARLKSPRHSPGWLAVKDGRR